MRLATASINLSGLSVFTSICTEENLQILNRFQLCGCLSLNVSIENWLFSVLTLEDLDLYALD